MIILTISIAFQTEGAADWEFFKIKSYVSNDDDRYFLAVANSFSIGSGMNGTLTQIISSQIYELNLRDEQFVLYQEIQTNG